MQKTPFLFLMLSLGTFAFGKEGPRHMRASVRHIEAGGIGYNKGYTTLEAFIGQDPNLYPVMAFLDGRGHVFNDGKWAFNAGLGVRSVLGCRAYGINLYYDYRNTHRRTYNQVGLGLETLGDWWDLRVNGYFPAGSTISHPYNPKFGGFSGHSILVDRRVQYAMTGVDGEAGFHFDNVYGWDLYAAAGPYYFKGERGSGAIGGKGRVAASYKDYVTFELSDSWDNVFHNNVQGQLTLTLPFGPKRARPKVTENNCPDTCDSARMLARRMVQPAVRQEIIVVDTDTKRDSASSYIIFVDNESHSEGTFESPYPTLGEAEAASTPGSIVYVFPGNGSAYDTSVISTHGMTLLDSQMLLGAATSHTVSTNLGTITIPALATTAPVISNEGIYGVGVTLANNNTVSGFSFVGNGTSQSGLEGVNITHFTSTQNSFSGMTSGYGILLGPLSGQVEIANNTFTGNYVGLYVYDNSIETLTISGSTFSDNTYIGAMIESSGSIDNLIVSGTDFINNQNTGFFLNNGLSVGTLSFNGCTFDNNHNDGIDIQGSVGSLTTLYSTITRSSNSGLVLDSDSSVGTFTITGCNISGNDNEGLFIAAPVTGSLTISGSHFDSNVGGHGFIFTNQATCNNVRVYQNTFNNNGRQGINANLSNCTSGQIAIFDNVFVNNDSLMEVGYAGAFTMSAGSACLQFTNNSASPTSYMGFDAFYWGQTGGTFNVTTDSTNANNNGGVISQAGTIGICP